MNHELVMLRGLKYCEKSVKELQEECLSVALKSFSTENFRDGTIGQMQTIAQLSAEKENFEMYLDLVKQALKQMPAGYRALILAVYVKRIPKEEICKKYHVSMSTVYRKLVKARQSFRNKLEQLGCTESWFAETYGDTEWVHAMLARPRNGARIAE